MEKQIANAKIVKDKFMKASTHCTPHISLSLCVCAATDDRVQSSTPQRKSRTNQERTVQ